MASSTDYTQAYQKAERAYMQGSYENAAAVIDQLAAEYPTDPSVLLLRGHIYCYGLQQYREAKEQYQAVLEITSDPEFVDFANNGLAYAEEQFEAEASSFDQGFSHSSVTVIDDSPEVERWDDDLSAADSDIPPADNGELPDFELEAIDVELGGAVETPESDIPDLGNDPFSNPFDAADDELDPLEAEAIDTAFSTDPFATPSVSEPPPSDFGAEAEEDPFASEGDLSDIDLPDSFVAEGDPFSDFENLETAETDPMMIETEGTAPEVSSG